MDRFNIDGDKIPIGKFSLENMVENPAMVMIAKRGSGKSVLVKDILFHFSSIPVGIIIAPSDKMDCFYGKFFPQSFIFYDYKSEIIERLLTRQKKIKAKNDERIKNGKSPIDTRAFIVMDDCLSQKSEWGKDDVIKELLFNGRHYDIMYILTMQYPLGIIPELRTNFDYIFLLADDFGSNQKRMYEHYAGMFQNLEHFKQVFMQLTTDYGSMVIINRGSRIHLWEKIFWYKARYNIDETQKFGISQFRDYHDKNYDERWEKKKELFNIDEYYKKKRRKYSVKKI